MTMTEKTTGCKDCDRTHTDEMICPRRTARAITNPIPANLQALTEADTLYIQGARISVEDIIEDAIAEDVA